jgi:hypothetical protein
MFELLLWIMFLHWVADFVAQSDWMARNKSKKMWPLFCHCATYGIVMLFGMIFADMSFGLGVSALYTTLWALFNATAHFLIDGVTSRVNSWLWEKKDVHNFFVSIGFDQYIHFLLLALSAKMLLV